MTSTMRMNSWMAKIILLLELEDQKENGLKRIFKPQSLVMYSSIRRWSYNFEAFSIYIYIYYHKISRENLGIAFVHLVVPRHQTTNGLLENQFVKPPNFGLYTSTTDRKTKKRRKKEREMELMAIASPSSLHYSFHQSSFQKCSYLPHNSRFPPRLRFPSSTIRASSSVALEPVRLNPSILFSLDLFRYFLIFRGLIAITSSDIDLSFKYVFVFLSKRGR